MKRFFRTCLTGASLAAVIVTACAGFSSRALAQPNSLQAGSAAFGSLSVADRLKLDPATVVQLPNGRSATLRQLLAEHAARLARFAAASSLAAGRSAGVRGGLPPMLITLDAHGFPLPAAGSPPLAYDPKALRPSPSPTGLIVGSGAFKSAATAAPTSPPDTLVFSAQKYANPQWAVDYDAFCSQARATACLYVPGGSLLVEMTSNAITDDDPLMTPAQCAQFNGSMLSLGPFGPMCVLQYPLHDSANFFPGVPPSAQFTGTCQGSDGFAGTLDPHGAVEVDYDGLTTTQAVELPSTVTCVVQVFAPPGNS